MLNSPHFAMKISTVPITHRIKHLQPIFSITMGNKYFCTGGINGEVKLWDFSYNHVKTIKKHTGSVTCVRFSTDNKFLASSGDDGKIFVMDCDGNEVLKVIKHPSDVTHFEWTPEFLVSTNLDGELLVTKISDFTEFRKMKSHDEPILGMAFSRSFKFLSTYSESKIVLYEDFNIKTERATEKGTILENLQSKVSFSPDEKFISVGLQFNNKLPTVDILNLDLKQSFSLTGHVAPCEIAVFHPRMFKMKLESTVLRYALISVASQDLSLSIWNTLNPKPFVLVKNFTEQPVLDMFWDGLVLYVSSYDGVVRRVEFSREELGEEIEVEEEYVEKGLPFSDTNIEMKKSLDRRTERLDLEERIEVIKMEGYTLPDGRTLKDHLRCAGVSKCADAAVKDTQEESVATSGCVAVEKKGNVTVSIKKDNTPTTTTAVVNNTAIDNTVTNNTATDNTLTNNTANTTPINNNDNSNKLKKKPQLENFKLETLPKRISPVLLDKKTPVVVSKESSTIFLFDTALPEKLRLEKTEPFRITLGDFTVILDDENDISVLRSSKFFYKITGPCNKVCFNDRFLVVYTRYVQIYELETGVLYSPFISIRLAFLDLNNDDLLLVNSYGDFQVLNLVKNKTVQDKLPKTKGLTKIKLSKTHFVLAEYDDGSELLFYNRKMKSWIAINPRFNSITTTGADYLKDYDDTINELEVMFMHYSLVRDQKNMKKVLKQVVGILKRMKRIDEVVEYKMENMFLKIEDQKMVRMLLEELNEEIEFQKFVMKIHQKLNC